jgi:hypothetical protein
MTLADDLRAARALIDTPEKWGRHTFRDDAGRLCVRGACGAAVGGVFGGAGARDVEWALLKVLPKWVRQSAGPLSMLANFNDDPATTHSDVLSLFDRAINAAEQVWS